MSTLTTEHLTAGRNTAAEVIAGLVNDGSALPVARAAVHEAATRHCAVRFVQVVGVDLDAEARTEADAATFQAALTALRGHPRLRCTFEVVSGSPGRKLVERSRRAAVLVVGDDDPGSGASVAAYCQRHAACVVQLVPQPA
jgi:hypothetical protein